MLTIHIEGQANQVRSFLDDLQKRPQIELQQLEVQYKEKTGNPEVKVSCYVKHYPGRKVRIVSMLTTDGVKVEIPMLDLVGVDLEEGKKLFVGRSFDIFASPEEQGDQIESTI